jgi:hypothetical protein
MAAKRDPRCLYGPCGDDVLPTAKRECTAAEKHTSPADYHNPITDAKFAHTCKPYTDMSDAVYFSPVCYKGGAYLPVSRYGGKGDRGGAFYAGGATTPPDVLLKHKCGRYYFYEPDSNVLMHLGRTAVFGDKVHAYIFLMAIVLIAHGMTESLEELEKHFTGRYDVQPIQEGKIGFLNIPREFMAGLMDPNNVHRYFNSMVTWERFKARFGVANIPSSVYWQWHVRVYEKPIDDFEFEALGGASNIWKQDEDPYYKPAVGEYDMLDQYVCRVGQFVGLDTIILQHEPEPDESNTEIIDLRARPDDYLCNITDDRYIVPRPPALYWDKYPSVWFKDYGFLIVNSAGFSWSNSGYIYKDPIFTSPEDASISGTCGGVINYTTMPVARPPDPSFSPVAHDVLGRSNYPVLDLQLKSMLGPNALYDAQFVNFFANPFVFGPLWNLTSRKAMENVL